MELASLPRRDYALIVSERDLDPPAIGLGRRLRLNMHRLADAVVPNSHAQHDRIHRIAPYLSHKTETISNGVDLRRFSPLQGRKMEGPGRVRLLVPARVARLKNPFGLLEAAAEVSRRRPDVDWGIDWYGDPDTGTAGQGRRWARGAKAGQEEYFGRFMAEIQVRSLQDRFRWHPPVRDVLSLYHAADAVCLPSHHEGTSNVVGEAMACGLPVLASRISDTPRLVEDGRSGLLFDPASPSEIADAIVRFADMPAWERERMGLEGRRRAESLLSPDTMVESYVRLITHLVHERRTP